MNSSINIGKIFLLLVGLIGALSVMTVTLTSGGNTVGQAALYGMIGCYFFGVVSPRNGVFLLIVLAAYSDLLKRMLVIETQVSMLDITYVLGMAPLALAGSVTGILLKKVTSREFSKRDLLTFGVPTGFMLVGASMGLVEGAFSLRSLRAITDYGAFAYLLCVLPVVFPTRTELLKLFKFTLIVFVPVAAYGIWQRTFGLADFELAYLQAGLSNEERQLLDVSIRPFSTLNAATSLTMVTANAVMFCLILRRTGRLGWVATGLLIGLFSSACYMTFTRVGWVVLAASVLLIPLLRSKMATVAIYVVAILGFVGLVWQAQNLRDRLDDWQEVLYGKTMTADKNQALRVMTLADRLIGFENMKLSENWTPFGVGEGSGPAIEGLSNRYTTTFSHDAVSGFLFRFGYVPFSFAVGFLGFAVYRLHSAVFRLPLERQRQAQLGLAGLFGAFLSITTGNTMFQFPANIFAWMLMVWILMCIWEKEATEGESVLAKVPEAHPGGGRGGRRG